MIGSLSGQFASFYHRLSDSSNLRDPPPSDLSAPSVTVTGEGQEAGWGGEGVGSAAFAVFTGDKQNVGEREFKARKITSHHVCAFTRACLVRITARLRNRTRNLNSIMLGKQPDTE